MKTLKSQIKKLLRETGLWYPLKHFREIPAITAWLRNGCQSPPPHLVKLYVIRYYCQRFALLKFVETGTFLGETAEWMARMGLQVVSIELGDHLYRSALNRLRHYGNVTLIQGDSAQVLQDILGRMNEPACFWLDAHYSGGETAKGEVYSPIQEEISAILSHPVKEHVILIDDARCFQGLSGYPHLDELLCNIRGTGHYAVEVSTDIIRITPQRTSWRSRTN